MEGSVFIIKDDSWHCSNMATLEVESDIITHPDGKKVSLRTNTLKIKHIFTVGNPLERDDLVSCVFKTEETDTVLRYECVVKGKTNDLLVLNILQTIPEEAKIREVLDLIKI